MKIEQQCRRFFQAAKGGQIPLTKWFVPRLAILTAVLLFFGPGCASLTPERINAIAAIAGAAAQIGATIWLEDHPEHQQAFDAVILALSALARAGPPVSTNQETFIQVLSSLPTMTLEGGQGALYMSERLVVWDEKAQRSTAVVGALEGPVRRATLSGLKAAMAPQPPVPNPKPMTDAQLDRQFEAIKARLTKGHTPSP